MTKQQRAKALERTKNCCEVCGTENNLTGSWSLSGDKFYTQKEINGMNSDTGFSIFGEDNYPKTITIVLAVITLEADQPGTPDHVFCQRCRTRARQEERRENFAEHQSIAGYTPENLLSNFD